jgi:DNA-binding transcriptional LysR family regulator
VPPLVPEFLANHPAIALDIVLADQVVDLLEQCADIAPRGGPLKNSQLVARKPGDAEQRRIEVPVEGNAQVGDGGTNARRVTRIASCEAAD